MRAWCEGMLATADADVLAELRIEGGGVRATYARRGGGGRPLLCRFVIKYSLSANYHGKAASVR